jgi:Ser/Thr protein kinase RdoA (MazF antagonist)
VLAFERLTYRGTPRRLRRLARHALEQYALGEARLTLLKHAAWSTTFRVDVASPPRRYVLRVHAPDQANAAEASSELRWLLALRRDTDLAVPEPVAAPAGALAVTAEADGVPGPRACVLLHWLDGRFLTYRPGLATVHQVGQFMARLHCHAERFASPPGFTRHRLDPGAFLRDWSPAALMGAGGVSADQVAVAVAAAKRLGEEATAFVLSPATFGLIHADLHPTNLLVRHGQVRAIDFGDCAFGPFAYDMAVWLVQLAERGQPDHGEKRAAFFAGYRSVRSLPPEQLAQISACMAWRRLEDLDWPLAMAGHPKVCDWVATSLPGAVRALRRFADGETEAVDGLA